MISKEFSNIFTNEKLDSIFPPERADHFFEALYGDVSDGAYDISLEFKGLEAGALKFQFLLKQRPGKCLACNLTYGLPAVFERHPLIDMNGLLKKINELLKDKGKCKSWKLGATQEKSRQLHIVPVTFDYQAF